MKERYKYILLATLLGFIVGGVAFAFGRKPTMLRCGRENLFVLDEYNPGFLLLHCKDSKREYVITLVDE